MTEIDKLFRPDPNEIIKVAGLNITRARLDELNQERDQMTERVREGLREIMKNPPILGKLATNAVIKGEHHG